MRKEESPWSRSQDFPASLHDRCFMSQARRARHFERSVACDKGVGEGKPELLPKNENNCLNLMAYRDYHRK